MNNLSIHSNESVDDGYIPLRVLLKLTWLKYSSF